MKSSKMQVELIARWCPPAGFCPAIYRTDRNTFLVIGKVRWEEVPSDVQACVGPDERLVEVPEDLLHAIGFVGSKSNA